ncbi:UNVERIFIED_CONTAM: hypothetical protein K2H54_000618 [Gekko kuhli]
MLHRSSFLLLSYIKDLMISPPSNVPKSIRYQLVLKGFKLQALKKRPIQDPGRPSLLEHRMDLIRWYPISLNEKSCF